MPTSSQALILTKNDTERVAIPLPTSQTAFLRDLAPVAHAAIYNLNGCIPLTATGHMSLENKAIQSMGRQSAMRLKVQTANNSTSILAWDIAAQTFRWQVIDGSQPPPKPPVDRRVSFTSVRETRTRRLPPETPRPLSATSLTPTKPLNAYPVDPVQYDKLVDLGFRKSSLVVDKTSPPASPRVGNSRSASVGFCQQRNAASVRTVPEKRGKQPEISISLQADHKSWQSDDDQSGSSDEDDDDVTDSDVEEVVEYTRIKPTIYMRKELPDPRPLAAVFSFRDNENISHADVKYLIEYQLCVRVASVQYDPLNVRVVRNDVRSRWFVDFKTQADLDAAVRSGLVVGKDKIIMYRFDDLAKREMSSFKFFMTIQEAKKKLKSSTSWKKARLVKTAIKLRATQSNKL